MAAYTLAVTVTLAQAVSSIEQGATQVVINILVTSDLQL